MVNVLTTGAVKQREVTDPITICCGAEQSPYARILVHRPPSGGRYLPIGGHLPAVATLRRHALARWSEAVDVPSDIVQRPSLSAITTAARPCMHVPMPTAINHRFREHVAVEPFELIGRTPDWLSRYEIGKSYDLGNGRRQTLSIVKLCHQIVHSFIFTFSVDSTGLFDGVYVTSDYAHAAVGT
jgi:hypothetical protein